jgi:hypothetical protein
VVGACERVIWVSGLWILGVGGYVILFDSVVEGGMRRIWR